MKRLPSSIIDYLLNMDTKNYMGNRNIKLIDLLTKGVKIIKNPKKFIYFDGRMKIRYGKMTQHDPTYFIFDFPPKIVRGLPFIYEDGEVYITFSVTEYYTTCTARGYYFYVSPEMGKHFDLTLLQSIAACQNYGGDKKGGVFSDYLMERGVNPEVFDLFLLNGYVLADSNITKGMEKLFEQLAIKRVNYMCEPTRIDSIQNNREYRKNIAKVILGTDILKRVKNEIY